MTNGLHGTEEVQQEGEDEVWSHQDRQVWRERLFDLAGNQEGRQLLLSFSWADEETPESRKEPQLTAPLVTQEVEVQRLEITEKLMPNVRGVKYSYGKAGMKAAAKAKKRSKKKKGAKA